jgi:hypothetical protein
VINIVLTLFIKSDNRYWVISVPLLLFLFISFTGWRSASDKNVKEQETIYWKSTGTKSYGDHSEWTKLEKMKMAGRQINATFIDLITLQAFLAFTLQVIGRRNTNTRIYNWTSWATGVLFFIILWFRLMMSIVPSKGFVT